MNKQYIQTNQYPEQCISNKKANVLNCIDKYVSKLILKNYSKRFPEIKQNQNIFDSKT